MSIGEPQESAQGLTNIDQQFIKGVFIQAKELPGPKQLLKGKFFDSFVAILRHAHQELQKIDSAFPNWLLRPPISYTNSESSYYSSLAPNQANQINQVRLEQKKQQMVFIHNEIVPALSSQELPTGLLTTPSLYYPQERARGCSAANFRMIFQELTGQNIPERDIFAQAVTQGSTVQIPLGISVDEGLLLNIFQTNAFKKRFPSVGVIIVPMSGVDFDDIISFIQKIKQKFPSDQQMETFVTISIQSEVTEEGWHQVLLLSADKESVVIHDPSNLVGGANRKLPKDQFSKRWGKTLLGGNVVFATHSRYVLVDPFDPSTGSVTLTTSSLRTQGRRQYRIKLGY